MIHAISPPFKFFVLQAVRQPWQGSRESHPCMVLMQPYSLPATAHTGSLCFNARTVTVREYHYVDKKVMAIILLMMTYGVPVSIAHCHF
ncbi:hypothetical protein [Streptococcus anginosus]|uniref:hypothetical protein n=2 Tax=Streptococcus TaxID=1301 RepID=UPI0032199A1E